MLDVSICEIKEIDNAQEDTVENDFSSNSSNENNDSNTFDADKPAFAEGHPS